MQKTETDFPIVLFDGVCNLCNGAVQWIINRDKQSVFRFGSLQSEIGQALQNSFNVSPLAEPESVILIHQDKVYMRSDAALVIASLLPAPWSWLRIFRWIPRGFRDTVYKWIARNRYRWFGRREQCMLPSPELRSRFL